MVLGLFSYACAGEKLPKRTEEEMMHMFSEMKENVELINGKWQFSKVVEQEGSAQVLYDQAIEAIAQVFRDIKAPIQEKDRDAGRVVVKMETETVWNRTGMFTEISYVPQYILTIDTKDNRYRMRLLVNGLVRKDFNSGAIVSKDISIEDCYPYNSEVKKKDWNKSFQGLFYTYTTAQNILKGIESLMNTPSDDNW